MTAAKQDITIEQGADYFDPWFVRNANGSPVNLTGATAVMQVRSAPNDPCALLTLSTSDGSLVIGGNSGTITPHLLAAATERLQPGLFVYDIKLLDSGGRISRPFQGTATVSAEVTSILPPVPPPGSAFDFSDSANSILMPGVF